MCGISGVVKWYGTADHEQVAAMDATIAHRGPDASGHWSTENVILMHRRLAIIDRQGGAQPMRELTPAGNVVICFVGEVYNYLDLRAQLGGSYRFKTRSDTEVILAAYLKWGERAAERLRGMFAVAIWDGRNHKLVLMRDPIGVKTLFYYPITDGVLIGSEPKAIFAHPEAKPRVKVMGWQEMFAHTATPGQVVWDGMCEVKPGTTVSITQKGIRERRYWRLASWVHPHDEAATIQYTRSLLEQIAEEQLVGEVPLGLMCSGGLDSSLLVAMARAKWTGRPPKTFCIEFAGVQLGDPAQVIQVTEDAPFAQAVAVHCGTDHRRVVLESGALADPELRARTVWTRDLPHAIAERDIAHLLLFEQIRRDVAVVWSGQMADELFGGYPIFYHPRTLGRSGWPWKVLNHRERVVTEYYLNDDLASDMDLPRYLADTFATARAEVDIVAHESPRERAQRVINYLEITRHAAILLNFTDRLSMAVGLEVRVPYCDHRLVEYGFNIPWPIKAPGDETKGLLKRVAQGLLPDRIIERPKSAFPMPPHLDYIAACLIQLKELVRQADHPVWQVMRYESVAALADWPAQRVGSDERQAMSQALELAAWLEMYEPAI